MEGTLVIFAMNPLNDFIVAVQVSLWVLWCFFQINKSISINSRFVLRFFMKNNMGTAIAISGSNITLILNLKPRMATSHDVNVEPKLAPKITAIDCSRLISPALTNDTAITVDAEELCINAVIKIPVVTPIKRLRVMALRKDRKRSPAAFCKPSLITFIPYRNKHIEPIKAIKSSNE